MLTLIRNGGFPMLIILAFGLTALASAARYALAPRLGRLDFVEQMAAATRWATLAGLAADLGATCIHITGNDEWANDPKMHLLVLRGVGESMSPLIMGFAMLALVAFLVAIGKTREPLPPV